MDKVYEFINNVDKYFEALQLLGYNFDQTLQIMNASLDCIIVEQHIGENMEDEQC